RLAQGRVDGIDWYWPADEKPPDAEVPDAVRLLTPFDPVVWDRDRLELLWNWVYRFEAYTPPAKRKLGYYALPMLWRDRVIGWANATVRDGRLELATGFAAATERSARFRDELAEERDRLIHFLAL